MQKFFTVFALFAMLFLTACNTVQGMGRDVQRMGSGMEGVARKASR